VTGFQKDGASKAGARESEGPETIRYTQSLRDPSTDPQDWSNRLSAPKTPQVQPPASPESPARSRGTVGGASMVLDRDTDDDRSMYTTDTQTHAPTVDGYTEVDRGRAVDGDTAVDDTSYDSS